MLPISTCGSLHSCLFHHIHLSRQLIQYHCNNHRPSPYIYNNLHTSHEFKGKSRSSSESRSLPRRKSQGTYEESIPHEQQRRFRHLRRKSPPRNRVQHALLQPRPALEGFNRLARTLRLLETDPPGHELPALEHRRQEAGDPSGAEGFGGEEPGACEETFRVEGWGL